MKKLLITIIAVLVALPALAQNINVKGVVRDDTGEVLAEAGTVVDRALADGSGQYTIS